MKKRLLSLLHFVPSGVIIILGLLVIRANYQAGTILSGWDDLHPEYNLSANIARSFSAVWQEYQGLGLLGGMSHAADLVRQLFMALVSPVVPLFLQRYLWTGLMLIIGPLGVYLLLKQIFTKTKSLGIELAAMTSAVLYLFNLATVQYFFTPFETFVAFYGFLPWLVFGALRYLQQPKRKNFILFCIVSLLATPSFYVQTLFFVWLMIVSVLAFEAIIREKKAALKPIFRLFVSIFVTNAFWLLPVIFFTITNSHVVQLAKGNVLSTEDTQLMNQGFGNLADVALLRGYWFEYTDANTAGTDFDYLMPVWRDYVSQRTVAAVGYILFLLSAIGSLFIAFIKRKTLSIFVPLVLLLGYFMLANVNGLTGPFFTFINTNVPLFGQIFRSVFTKWSTVLSLALALGGGGFVAALLSIKVNKLHISRNIISSIFALLIMGMAIFTTKPIWEGKLISDSMRVSLPQTYLDLFDYFKTQPKQSRIAFFPVQTFWGWNFYDWGYRGSGFLWYGIEQPILDRAFDVWSRENETFYQEVSTAMYAKDEQRLAQVLKKYNVSFILMDESVTIPGGDDKQLYIPQSKEMFQKIGASVAWERDFVTVYDLRQPLAIAEGFIYAPHKVKSIDTDVIYSRQDSAYQDNFDYITYPDAHNDTEYLFSQIFKEKTDGVRYLNMLDGSTYISFNKTVNTKNAESLSIPAIARGTTVTGSAKVSFDGSNITLNFNTLYEVKVDGQAVYSYRPTELILPLYEQYEAIIIDIQGQKVAFQKGEEKPIHGISIDPYAELSIQVYNGFGAQVPTIEPFSTLPINTCWEKEAGQGTVDFTRNAETLSITSVDAVGCMAFKLGEWQTDSLLNVALPYQSEGPAKPHFCVTVEGAPDCITDDIFYNSEVNPQWTTVDRELSLQANTPYWMVISARPPEGTQSHWTINYQNPSVSVYPKIHSFSFASTLWEGLTKEQKIAVDSNIQNVSINVSTYSKEISLAKRGRAQAHNCDLFERGSVGKIINAQTAIYTAKDRGASCDFAILAGSASTQQYLLRITGKNTSGRSAKIYLFNQASSRNDIEDLLPKEDFDVSYAMLAWQNYPKREYILNVETRSFGNEESKNEIREVELYQLPINWVGKWQLHNINNDALLDGQLTIENSHKYGTWLYTAEASGKGVIALSQGYDTGWVSLSGLEHVKLNGWANAWIKNTDSSDRIILFYWPQLLQFVGFGLLICLTITIGYPTIHKHFRSASKLAKK